MKRYLVFAGDKDKAVGGTDDIAGVAGCHVAALNVGEKDLEKWSEIYDIQLGMAKMRHAGELTWGDWYEVRP